MAKAAYRSRRSSLCRNRRGLKRSNYRRRELPVARGVGSAASAVPLVSARMPDDHSRLHACLRNSCHHPHRPAGQIAARSSGNSRPARGYRATRRYLHSRRQGVLRHARRLRAVETNLRRERHAEGIPAARKRGIYKGHPPKIDRAEILRLQQVRDPARSPRSRHIARQVRKGVSE